MKKTKSSSIFYIESNLCGGHGHYLCGFASNIFFGSFFFFFPKKEKKNYVAFKFWTVLEIKRIDGNRLTAAITSNWDGTQRLVPFTVSIILKKIITIRIRKKETLPQWAIDVLNITIHWIFKCNLFCCYFIFSSAIACALKN